MMNTTFIENVVIIFIFQLVIAPLLVCGNVITSFINSLFPEYLCLLLSIIKTFEIADDMKYDAGTQSAF